MLGFVEPTTELNAIVLQKIILTRSVLNYGDSPVGLQETTGAFRIVQNFKLQITSAETKGYKNAKLRFELELGKRNHQSNRKLLWW